MLGCYKSDMIAVSKGSENISDVEHLFSNHMSNIIYSCFTNIFGVEQA